MRIDTGKLINNPLCGDVAEYEHLKYVFIPDGVDYRYRVNSDGEVTGLLR